jgi:hypothetical protein
MPPTYMEQYPLHATHDPFHDFAKVPDFIYGPFPSFPHSTSTSPCDVSRWKVMDDIALYHRMHVPYFYHWSRGVSTRTTAPRTIPRTPIPRSQYWCQRRLTKGYVWERGPGLTSWPQRFVSIKLYLRSLGPGRRAGHEKIARLCVSDAAAVACFACPMNGLAA